MTEKYKMITTKNKDHCRGKRFFFPYNGLILLFVVIFLPLQKYISTHLLYFFDLRVCQVNYLPFFLNSLTDMPVYFLKQELK